MLARQKNGDFLISLHRNVSETALIQMMLSLRALDPGFEMSLEMAGNHPSPVTPGYLPAACLARARHSRAGEGAALHK